MSREKRGIKNKSLRRLGDTLVLASHSLMEQSKPSCACAGLWPPKKNWIELNKKWWCLVQTNRNKKFSSFSLSKKVKASKVEAGLKARKHDAHQHQQHPSRFDFNSPRNLAGTSTKEASAWGPVAEKSVQTEKRSLHWQRPNIEAKESSLVQEK